jgi:predicted permease
MHLAQKGVWQGCGCATPCDPTYGSIICRRSRHTAIMAWWQRFRRRAELEEQLDKELRFHLEQHAADLAARGEPHDQARREANIALGGLEKVKEECRDARGTHWLEDFWQDVRYAVRTLGQRPGFASVAILTLALGTGATTVMFTVMNSVLFKPLPYREPHRLLTLSSQTAKYGENWGCSYLDFLDLQRQSQSLEAAAWTGGGGTLGDPRNSEYVGGVWISSNLFAILGVPLIQGRGFLPEEDRPGGTPVVIISAGLWQRRYSGSAGVVGTSLTFEGKRYTVVGIAGSSFGLVDEDIYTPLGQSWDDRRMQNRAARFIHVLARLRSGVAASSAQMELDLIAGRLAHEYPKFDAGRRFLAHPLSQELVKGVRPALWLLLGAVGSVLLIACANIASLLLARAVSREREIAMRAALGARRGRLVRQCLTESSVLALAGGSLGVVLAVLGIRPFVTFWPGSLPRAEEIAIDWRVLLFALAASLLSGLFFGLAPAMRISTAQLERTLRTGMRTGAGSSRRMHGAFVVCELALAVVLLVSTGMLGRTLLRLTSLDPGLNLQNVLTARVEPPLSASSNAASLRATWERFLEITRATPGVESAVLADIIPMRAGENSLGYWTTSEIPPPDRLPLALASCVTPDYLKVMGTPLRRGRFFTEQDRLDSMPVIVIDDVLAEHAFGATDPVGRRLWVQGLGPGPVQVVGVIGHVRHWGVAGDDQSMWRDHLYYPFAQVPDHLMPLLSSVMSFAVRTKVEPLSLAEPLQHAVRNAGAGQVLHEFETLEQLASASLSRQRFLLLLFGIFAGFALLLACIGLYGVLAYLTGQRVPEIGLRMAMGASAGELIWMVLGHSLAMVLAGVGIGLAASLAVAQLLQRSVAGMQPAAPSTFAIMIAVLVTAALAASFVPAYRASRIDPMNALRQN